MIKRILVPVDFSPPSLSALEYAIRVSRPLNAELATLFVVEPAYVYGTPTDVYGPPADFGWVVREEARRGRERLARLAADLRKRKLHVHALVRRGKASQCILSTAQRLRVDLIIMATHGRTGLSHLLLGSTAEKVVRLASCPVLTVRPVAARLATRGAARRSPRL